MPIVLDDLEWDDDKEKANIRKHGVSFHESRALFNDLNHIEKFDRLNSDDEERFVAIGSSGKQILVAAYTPRGKKLRMISLRKATKKEKDRYLMQAG